MRLDPFQQAVKEADLELLSSMNKVYSIERQLRLFGRNKEKIDQEMAEINAVLATLKANYATLPEGELRDHTAERITVLTQRLVVLSKRAPNYSETVLDSKRRMLVHYQEHVAIAQAYLEQCKARRDQYYREQAEKMRAGRQNKEGMS